MVTGKMSYLKDDGTRTIVQETFDYKSDMLRPKMQFHKQKPLEDKSVEERSELINDQIDHEHIKSHQKPDKLHF